jgi:hypothetical protein
MNETPDPHRCIPIPFFTGLPLRDGPDFKHTQNGEGVSVFNRINWVAVAATVIALEGLGFVWYAVLFGDAWSAAYVESFGRVPDESNMAVMRSLGMVNTLILSLGLATILPKLGVTGLKAVIAAVMVWFGFGFTTMAIEYLYMGVGLRLVGLNMAYQLVAYLVAGTVIGLMPAKAPPAPAEE